MNVKSWCVVAGLAAGAAVAAGAHLFADEPFDFGLAVQQGLREHSWQLFGIQKPLGASAVGPFTDRDSTKAITLAAPLRASLVSSSVHFSADQIALWPNDDRPTHLFVCSEEDSSFAVMRVDLAKPAASNATTIVTGISSCDPIRRTPWGSIVVAEEAGATGGFYEIMDPQNVNGPVAVLDRTTGQTTDPRVVKRKAVGSLSFEGIVILPDGTTYYGDELAPGNGVPGGGMYKFVPAVPRTATGVVTDPAQSPLASGSVFGLRVGPGTHYGQGSEIGKGRWTAVDASNPAFFQNGNLILRLAQAALKFTGYYRPEDMDLDPIAWKHDEVRMCWANTGSEAFGGGSEVETDAVYGEIMCLQDDDSVSAPTGAIPFVTRFVAGNPEAAMFDNVDFQPNTGNLVMTEDGPTSIVKDGVEQPRGNDLWMCLPDGHDNDVQTDGCIRIASLRDTDSEPTGFIFTGSGESAFVSLQHRSTNTGALLKISGFAAPQHHCERDKDDDFFVWHRRAW
jgi:secreted PhoX family phosphatase